MAKCIFSRASEIPSENWTCMMSAKGYNLCPKLADYSHVTCRLQVQSWLREKYHILWPAALGIVLCLSQNKRPKLDKTASTRSTADLQADINTCPLETKHTFTETFWDQPEVVQHYKHLRFEVHMKRYYKMQTYLIACYWQLKFTINLFSAQSRSEVLKVFKPVFLFSFSNIYNQEKLKVYSVRKTET